MLFFLGEKPFECNECGRRFARSTDLKVHMPVHSEDKPYKCGECEKMFTRFSTLKEHIRTHTGNRLQTVTYNFFCLREGRSAKPRVTRAEPSEEKISPPLYRYFA